METTTTVPNNTSPDVYSIINDRVIQALEQGTVPWHQPWKDGGVPQNLISKRPYRGINLLLLLLSGHEHNLFLTYKQVNEIGGKIKQGEKGQMIVFWNQVEQDTDKDEENVETETKKKIVLRYYYVFNIDQCENIPDNLLPEETTEREVTPIRACEDIILNMPEGPHLRHKEQKAYYDPLRDYINMPKQKNFESDEAYYSTLFHEILHWTGHRSRLHRKSIIEMAEFGSDTYSQEELIAEIGTCYLQNLIGIADRFEQSIAYIQGWLQQLRNDKRFIFSAAREAQKAVDFILNVKDEGEEKNEES